MPSAEPSQAPSLRSDYDPEQELLALTEQTIRLVAVAQVLVSSSRRVDVGGLQQQVGLLCAKALDLPPDRTGFVRLEMRRLAAQMDALHSAMRQNAA